MILYVLIIFSELVAQRSLNLTNIALVYVRDDQIYNDLDLIFQGHRRSLELIGGFSPDLHGYVYVIRTDHR